MTSLRACYNAIGTYYNIAIEIYINFQCCQNHKVQFVDYCALVKRVCIFTGTDSEMPDIFY